MTQFDWIGWTEVIERKQRLREGEESSIKDESIAETRAVYSCASVGVSHHNIPWYHLSALTLSSIPSIQSLLCSLIAQLHSYLFQKIYYMGRFYRKMFVSPNIFLESYYCYKSYYQFIMHQYFELEEPRERISNRKNANLRNDTHFWRS